MVITYLQFKKYCLYINQMKKELKCNDIEARVGERKNYNKLSTRFTKISKLKGVEKYEVISYSGLAFR